MGCNLIFHDFILGRLDEILVHYTFKNSYYVVKFYWMENFDFGSWIMDFPLMKKYHKTTFSIENNYTYNVLIVLDPLDSNKI